YVHFRSVEHENPCPPMSDRIESIVNPELLAWARRSAGLSVADAARKIHVSEARVEEWERGVRKPTVTQLGNLADAYRRPLRVFFKHWRNALESVCVLVFQASKIELDEMRGFSITERPLPVVVVNIKDAFTARSFSLFHETAHVLLGRGGLCNFEENGKSNQA